MTNSMTSSPKPWLSSAKVWTILALVLLFAGFLDATYLTVEHYNGSNLKCVIAHGCDIVTTSKYATIGSVPISLFGVGYYVVTALLLLIALMQESRKVWRLGFGLVAIALAVSLVLVYLQVFVIHALCIYCLTSASITALTFILLAIPAWQTRSTKNLTE